MSVKYVVKVTRIIDDAGTGKEPKLEETELVDFTGGSDEASAVLVALAESIRGSKKVLGFARLLKVVKEQIEEQDAKAKEKGEPTVAQSISAFLASKQSSKTTR
jgi:PP-loop superfamily ATP-utilizing enzyme